MNDKEFKINGRVHPIVVTEECVHCGKQTLLEDFIVGLVIRIQATMLLYCSIQCQIAHTLDSLVRHIDVTGVLDNSWIPVIKQIHDQLEPKGEDCEPRAED